MASKFSSVLSPLQRQLCDQIPRRIATLRPSVASRLLPRSPTQSPLPIHHPQRFTFVRAAHSIPKPPPVQPREPAREADAEAPTSEGQRPAIQPSTHYQLSFTCVPCGHRSHHNVSKQGYHTGSVLITCPECRNRHVISDHLGIFGDKKLTVEDLMREKGQLVKRGTLGEDGDIEFWPDERAEEEGTESKPAGSDSS